MDFFTTTRAKGLGLALLALLAVILSTGIARLAPGLNFVLAIALLLFIYPLIAFLLGAASGFFGLKIWLPALITLVLFTALMLIAFNQTALSYLPFYLLATLAGFGIAVAIRWRLACTRPSAQPTTR